MNYELSGGVDALDKTNLAEFPIQSFLVPLVGDLWSPRRYIELFRLASSRAGRCALMDVACISLEFFLGGRRNARVVRSRGGFEALPSVTQN